MSDSNKKDDIAETTEKLENVTLNTSSTVTSSDNKKEAEQPKKESAPTDSTVASTKEETKENAVDDAQEASNDNQQQQESAASAPTDDKTETKQAQPQQASASAVATTAPVDPSQAATQPPPPQQQQQQQQAQQAKKSTVNEDPNNIDGDNTNLIINYLPPTMSEGTLATLFSPYGLLERCKIVVDLQTLRSRGYGFVKYDNEISAERALNALNGYELNGKKLKVAFARKQCKAITNANLYITNVPPHFTDNNLRKLFQDYGKIVECRVLMDQNGQSRGVGFVRMDTHHNAIQALQAMDQYVIDDKHPPLLVKLAQRRVPRRYWNSQNRNQNQGGKKNYNNNQGGMGGGMNNNMGGNRDNKNKKRNSPNNRKYYSPKNYNNNNRGGGGMGMDNNNNMNAPLGGNNMGGNNRGSPSKRGYYRAKNNQGQQFNKGSNQQIRSNQGNYNNNNRGNRGGGGAGPNNQAPYFPAPMHDAYPPYAATQMAYQQPAYNANIPNMNAALNNPSGVGGQQMSYKNQ
mmetsp:Transcript_38519/g.34083  ORF Transcript_38519/g.34083 Transcript_38519/m.34083 type:complete len:517 (+) Transcript_38519:212-1762(+)|eukprot:CAMPEP_0201564732 /NCGR_PEP_ID=MMETSP0190_2-20130828/3262_1 /ASSEMBLY_ACC=CAM_ASM_000263 /TAXON_ID=37353 /ORGANISM="Rosalina sp." /LENGTH=516 /DNA_ID=CAMNT_0047981293 /DNA_START=175 /DNA_END=1725 /DNA_ORIENTATION=+